MFDFELGGWQSDVLFRERLFLDDLENLQTNHFSSSRASHCNNCRKPLAQVICFNLPFFLKKKNSKSAARVFECSQNYSEGDWLPGLRQSSPTERECKVIYTIKWFFLKKNRCMYLVQDPKALKKERSKVDEKWKVLAKQAQSKNPTFKEPIGIISYQFIIK